MLQSSKRKLSWAELLSIMLAKANPEILHELLQPTTSPRDHHSAFVGVG